MAALGFVEWVASLAVVTRTNGGDDLEAFVVLAFEEHPGSGGVFEARPDLVAVRKRARRPPTFGIHRDEKALVVAQRVGTEVIEVAEEVVGPVELENARERGLHVL